MANQQLLDYIKQSLQQGLSERAITDALLRQGWQQQDINEAFAELQGRPQIAQQNPRPKTPWLIDAIGWLLLLGGIGRLLITTPLLLLGIAAKDLAIISAGLLYLITAVALIITSFGVRHMRRWALYSFTGLMAVQAIADLISYISSATRDITTFADIGALGLILIYFWANSKKFA